MRRRTGGWRHVKRPRRRAVERPNCVMGSELGRSASGSPMNHQDGGGVGTPTRIPQPCAVFSCPPSVVPFLPLPPCPTPPPAPTRPPSTCSVGLSPCLPLILSTSNNTADCASSINQHSPFNQTGRQTGLILVLPRCLSPSLSLSLSPYTILP